MSLLCRPAALLCARSACSRSLLRRPSVAASVAVEHQRLYADRMLADPLEHATGLEKRELLALAAGNDDPFHCKIIKRGAGTKDQPNQIPSAFDARIVGCVCQEDATYINWMWLHQGQPRRCECGHWFKLVEVKPI